MIQRPTFSMNSKPVGSITRMLTRPIVTFSAICRELAGSWRITDDLRSWIRLGRDIFLFRLLRLGWTPGKDETRVATLRGGHHLNYRLNRGDIQSIREVWYQEVYRIPFDWHARIIVDLGANIGLSSLWLGHRFLPERILAVEPSQANARLAEMNLIDNGLPADVLLAAVGAEDGFANFAESKESNLGQISDSGAPVRMVSMNTIIDMLPKGCLIDILKVDIEGYEDILFSGDMDWLDKVRLIVIEIHPDLVDRARLAQLIGSHGFEFIPAGSRGNLSDCFVHL